MALCYSKFTVIVCFLVIFVIIIIKITITITITSIIETIIIIIEIFLNWGDGEGGKARKKTFFFAYVFPIDGRLREGIPNQ